jgi:hypothetical protein
MNSESTDALKRTNVRLGKLVFEANVENAVLDEEWTQLKIEQTEAIDALKQSNKHNCLSRNACVVD